MEAGRPISRLLQQISEKMRSDRTMEVKTERGKGFEEVQRVGRAFLADCGGSGKSQA
jgi:hypothetical protein